MLGVQPKKRVLIDCDAATDDMVAIMYALSQPELDVRAITVAGTGEAHGSIGARNVANLVYTLGFENIRVGFGQDLPAPKSGDIRLPFPDWIRTSMDQIWDGENSGIQTNPKATFEVGAVELLKTMLEESNTKVTIIATGPLTNIAKLFQDYPLLCKDKIENIAIMGGAYGVAGNIKGLHPNSTNTQAECNILADPDSARIVFGSGLPITSVALDVTNQIPMTKAFYESLEGQESKAEQIVFYLFKKLIADINKAMPGQGWNIFLKEFYLWDPFAAMIEHKPGYATGFQALVTIDENTGKTLATENEQGNVYIPNSLTVKPGLVLHDLVEALKTFQRAQVEPAQPALTNSFSGAGGASASLRAKALKPRVNEAPSQDDKNRYSY